MKCPSTSIQKKGNPFLGIAAIVMDSSQSSLKSARTYSNGKKFLLRPAEKQDLVPITELLSEWAEEVNEIMTPPDLSQGVWLCCVSISANKVVGFAHFVHRTLANKEYLQGAQLYVLRVYRKTSAGSLLYRYALRFWKTTKLPMIVQSRWEDRALWEKRHYKPKFAIYVREP